VPAKDQRPVNSAVGQPVRDRPQPAIQYSLFSLWVARHFLPPPCMRPISPPIPCIPIPPIIM
jgi:hypothetical protein